MPNNSTQPLFDEARKLGIGFYLGYAELCVEDGETRHFNTAILVDGAGNLVGKYRKVHLPGHAENEPERPFQHLEKRYFEPGNLGFPVFQAFDGVVGMCICNDRQSPKIKSLANHCLDLRFRRPSPLEVTSALKRVVALEGYAVDEATLDKIAQACNADIRQMLNLLQIWRPKEGSPALSQAQVSANLRSSFKDISVGPFDVADRFFNAVHTSSVI